MDGQTVYRVSLANLDRHWPVQGEATTWQAYLDYAPDRCSLPIESCNGFTSRFADL